MKREEAQEDPDLCVVYFHVTIRVDGTEHFPGLGRSASAAEQSVSGLRKASAQSNKQHHKASKTRPPIASWANDGGPELDASTEMKPSIQAITCR